jgi:hypothetical protein
MHMYGSVCVFVSACVHSSVCACMLTFIRMVVRVFLCMHFPACVFMCACGHATHTFTRGHVIRLYVHGCMYVGVCVLACVRVHACMRHIHMYGFVCVCMRAF